MHKKVNLYRYLISFVLILLRFSLIFKGFQRLASWLLHHFYTIFAFGFIGFHQAAPFCRNRPIPASMQRLYKWVSLELFFAACGRQAQRGFFDTLRIS